MAEGIFAGMEQRRQARREDAFEKWLASGMVRLGISMIPPGDHHDALKLLLRSAFDAGAEAGEGSMALEVFERLRRREQGERGGVGR